MFVLTHNLIRLPHGRGDDAGADIADADLAVSNPHGHRARHRIERGLAGGMVSARSLQARPPRWLARCRLSVRAAAMAAAAALAMMGPR